MNFDFKQYLAYVISKETNCSEYSVIDWLKVLGDFKLKINRIKKRKEKNGEVTFYKIYPYYDDENKLGIDLSYVDIKVYKEDASVSIVGKFKDRPDSLVKIDYYPTSSTNNSVTISVLIDSPNAQDAGFYYYSSCGLSALEPREWFVFYDKESVDFMIEDLELDKETILRKRPSTLERIGFRPDYEVEGDYSGDIKSDALLEKLVQNSSYEGFLEVIRGCVNKIITPEGERHVPYVLEKVPDSKKRKKCSYKYNWK